MRKDQMNDTQFWDEKRNTVYPWYTKPCLDYLETLDLKKNVLEFGAGMSTVWWAMNAKRVVTIEANREWYNSLPPLRNVHAVCVEINEGDQVRKDEYLNAADNIHFLNLDDGLEELVYDIVIVDGILRNECLQKAIQLLSKNGGFIIADNWQQDYVWLSPAAEEIMKPYERKIFVQPTHTNHEGNPWKTAVFTIPKS